MEKFKQILRGLSHREKEALAKKVNLNIRTIYRYSEKNSPYSKLVELTKIQRMLNELGYEIRIVKKAS